MTGRGISNGPNGRPLDDTVAETGPGIPDDAVVDGELTPDAMGRDADAAVERLERSGWAKPPPDEAEAETQAQPS